MKKIIFPAFGAVVLMIFAQSNIFACECGTFKNPSIAKQVKGKLAISLIAFRGEVIKIEPQADGHSFNVKFNVAEYWKGEPDKELTLINRGDSCQYTFEAGEKYLVYAHVWEDVLTTNVCIGNSKLEDAAEELKVLGKGKKPQRKI